MRIGTLLPTAVLLYHPVLALMSGESGVDKGGAGVALGAGEPKDGDDVGDAGSGAAVGASDGPCEGSGKAVPDGEGSDGTEGSGAATAPGVDMAEDVDEGPSGSSPRPCTPVPGSPPGKAA
ncbi:MAG: hypothetical protein N2376_07710, partial [Clostridia bacterium]|nr:hypothetical protein [Clostridia bacterium]